MAGTSTFNNSLLNTTIISISRSTQSNTTERCFLPLPIRHQQASLAHRVGLRHRVSATTDDDEWGPDPRESGTVLRPMAVEEKLRIGDEGKIVELKKLLKEKLYGTDRGLMASSETRAEIVEIITQLEGLNPTPAPTETLTLLNGKWILA